MQMVLVLDPHDGASIRAVLAEEGFDCRIVESVAEALVALEHVDVSLVIMDHALPVSGWLLLPKLAGRPAIVCSEQQTITDRVTSLRLGADDFIGKPFDKYELTERVRAVLRRTYGAQPTREEDVLLVGELKISRTRATVTIRGVEIHVTPTEFHLLALLAKHPNELMTAEMIAQAVWGIDDGAVGHALQVHIGRLRLAFKSAQLSNPRILTVRARGYRLVFSEKGESS